MKIFRIFKKDLKNLIKHPAAIALIIGLCVIPSFYTWITLKANWNPYVDTGNIPVAVVNNDNGTIMNNKIVNFGKQVVDQLQNNTTMKWTFVGNRVAEKGLKDGSYYAIIEIPSNFSDDLKTIYTGNPVKPNVIYKVNEKTNAIATKITDLASGQLQEQIKQTFFDDVNKVVLNQANSLGKNISENKPMILELKNVISTTNQNVNNILNNINSSSINVSNLSNYLGTLKNNIPNITNHIQSLNSVISSSKDLISSTKSNLSNISNNLSNTNASIQNTNTKLNDFVSSLKNTIDTQILDNNTKNAANQADSIANHKINNATKTADKAKKSIDSINDKTNAAKTNINKSLDTANKAISVASKKLLTKEQIDADKKIVQNALASNGNLLNIINSANNTLNNLNKITNSNSFDNLIDDLNNLKSSINTQNSNLTSLAQNLTNSANLTANELNSKLDSILALSNETSSLINNFSSNYQNELNSNIATITNNLDNSLNNANSILSASNSMIPQLNEIASIGISASNLTVNQTKQLSNKLSSLKNTLSNLEDKTKTLNSTALDNLINLLEHNPTQLSSLLSSPVSVHVEELYGMSIFGIGLAPFYTVLSIWVGALLCTTIIRTNDPDEEDGTKKTLLQIHFGKMLLFLVINLIQATIVTVGDILVIGIHPENFWLLMAFSLFSSIVFTVIIFTFVSLNGNFGKAAALVLMVIQVAGSAAIYPIQVNPVIFQKLEFIWPFTYSIDGFRQAIGGPDWTLVHHDFIMLGIFLVLFLVLSLAKMYIHEVNQFFDKQFKESGL